MVDQQTKAVAKKEAEAPALLVGLGAIKNATEMANKLKKVIDDQKLFTVIQGRKFVVVEGWTTCGAMMGVFPSIISTEELPPKKTKVALIQYARWDKFTKKSTMVTKFVALATVKPGEKILEEREIDQVRYKAMAVLKTTAGVEIARAEALCSSMEEGKLQNDEFAIMSMAGTRATGKAFRLAFSWILKMAGYEATPAEEAPSAEQIDAQGEKPKAESVMEVHVGPGVGADIEQ